MIPQIRFTRETITQELKTSEIGNDFMQFAHDILSFEHQGLHVYPDRGKDGCIDMCSDNQLNRHVFECKFIGSDGYEGALNELKAVANKLEAYLSSPDGPTKGQAQYAPWYSTEKTIIQYYYCVSCIIGNENQKNKLQEYIWNTFNKLAHINPALKHLSKICVTIKDWQDFAAALDERPVLRFRWFRQFCPSGLFLFNSKKEFHGFRRFLSPANLPYYSLYEHEKKYGPCNDIHINEDEIVKALEEADCIGTIFVGKGGVGKTRIALEIANLCQLRSWTVLHVDEQLFDMEQFDKLISIVADTKVLLLFDYLEKIQDFTRIIARLVEVNNTLYCNLRFIACCRSHYYRKHYSKIQGHVVDLSPSFGTTKNWMDSYTSSAAVHILNNLFPNRNHHKEQVVNLPVVAVLNFILEETQEREPEHTLSTLFNFTDRIRNILDRTVPQNHEQLATLMCILPFNTTYTTLFQKHSLTQVYSALAADGWIERISTPWNENEDEWYAVHDAIADQVVLSYLEEEPEVLHETIGRILSTAADIGAVDSALFCFQRISYAPIMENVNWSKLIADEIVHHELQWSNANTALFRCSLLEPEDLISMLDNYPSIWSTVLGTVSFQKSLGWLTKNIQFQEASQSRKNLIEKIHPWLVQGIEAALSEGKSSYLLHQAFRLLPDEFKKSIIEWLEKYPKANENSYLFLAWLDNGLTPDKILGIVKTWLIANKDEPEFSIVLGRWSKAQLYKDSEIIALAAEWLGKKGFTPTSGVVIARMLRWFDSPTPLGIALTEWLRLFGDHPNARPVIEQLLYLEDGKALGIAYLPKWLELHGIDLNAERIYSACIRNKISEEYYLKYLNIWLSRFALHETARFVFDAYLRCYENQNDLSTLICNWFSKYALILRADFVLRAWIESNRDTTVVSQYIMKWLQKYGLREDARWLLKTCMRKKETADLVNDAAIVWCKKYTHDFEAGSILAVLLDSSRDIKTVTHLCQRWLSHHFLKPSAQYVYSAWLRNGNKSEQIQDLLIQWLPLNWDANGADWVYKEWLNAKSDYRLIEPYIIKWIEKNNSTENVSYVLAPYIETCGANTQIASITNSWLTIHAESESAQFVFSSWLRANGAPQEIEQSMVKWLEKFGTKPFASFVMGKWLEHGGSTITIQRFISPWLTINSTSIDALYFIDSCIKAQVASINLKEPLISCLQANGEEEHAQQLITSWLKTGGDKEVVANFLYTWLEKNKYHIDASFPLRAWLENHGDRYRIKSFVQSWLSKHCNRQEAGHVIRPWIGYGGELNDIKEYTRNWLSNPENCTFLDEHRVIYAWLNNGGDLKTIEPTIEKWLVAFANADKARYVLHSWLVAGGELIRISTHLKIFLTHNAKENKTEYVYRAWLIRGGSYSELMPALQLWYSQNWQEETAYDLANYLLPQGPKETELLKNILLSIAHFANNKDSLFRLCQFNDGDNLYNSEIARELLSTAKKVFSLRHKNPYDLSQQEIDQLTTLISYFVESYKMYDDIQLRTIVDGFFIDWLRNPASYKENTVAPEHLQRRFYFKKYVDLLCQGKINLKTDDKHICKFISWVNTWNPENKILIKGGVSHLRKKFKKRIERQISLISIPDKAE